MQRKCKWQSDIVWRNEGETEAPQVILVVSDMIHQLNGVGSLVWTLCDGLRSLDQIAGVVASEYEVETEIAAVDVREFVGELLSKGWLVDVT